MERKLIVNLLQKNIEELAMITEGFTEMAEYPAVIIQLARQKAEDILEYVHLLEETKNENIPAKPIIEPSISKESIEESIVDEILPIIDDVKEELTENEIDVEEESDSEIEEEMDEEEPQYLINEIIEEHLPEEIVIVEDSVEEVVENKIVEEEEIVLDEQIEEIQVQQGQKQEITDEQPKTFLGEQITKQTGESDNTIAGAHTNKKIDDIRHAISIGDRFRFQRELFDGNGELMNKTFFQLNQMNDFIEASTYMKTKFNWKEEDETVESFYQIVKRRYL